MTNDVETWQTQAAAFKQSVLARIPPEWLVKTTAAAPPAQLLASCGLLSAAELELLELDATALRDGLAAKTYSAVAVTTAFAKAAAVAHQATNCLMDYFYDEAIERAKWLDAELERTGKPVGPLHGVPVSVKDHLGLKGHELTAGFLSWVGKEIPAKDAMIISILRDAGAVFYVKTTNPQAIMQLETDSFLGPTLNPHNHALTPGGSSGGEGALIASGGSVLGIGTDIGGSIRNPAANCGIFGFKPTSIRLPKWGNRSAVAGNEAIVGAIGPMARSARDLELFVTTLLASEPWKLDPTQVGMPWRPSEVAWQFGGARPKIGVLWDDGVVTPQPPMRRALAFAVDKLKAAGFDVVDYKPYKQKEAWDIISALYFTDGGERVAAHCQASGEPVHPLTQWIIDQNSAVRSAGEIWDLTRARDMYRAEYATHFCSHEVDVILSPPNPGSAPALGTAKYWSYTAMFNLVDFPSGVFPTGLSVELSDAKDEAPSYLSDSDRAVSALYDPEVMIGAPLSLQVAAPRWEDEKAMAALRLISDVVRS